MADAPPEAPKRPHEEPPIPLTKSGNPDKRYTAGGRETTRKRAHRRGPIGTIDYVQLEDALYNGAMGVAMGMLMVSLPRGSDLDPRAIDALDGRARKFSASWVAAARQDERVARYLQTLLQGGVWIAAVGNTLAFGLLIGVFSGRVTTIPAPAQFFVPELQPFIVPTTKVSRENGNQSPGDQERGSAGGTMGDVPDSDSE